MKLCECGCGKPAPIATKTHTRSGAVKGQPLRFIRFHAAKTRGPGHAAANSPTYRSWSSLRQRCLNPHATGYENYGGRGIRFCERWEKFENFLSDMGERPEGTSLDRIDNDADYGPENCRWATAYEQTHNRRVQTHCPKGHAFDDENTYVAPSGARKCRTCRRAYDRARYAAQKVDEDGTVYP